MSAPVEKTPPSPRSSTTLTPSSAASRRGTRRTGRASRVVAFALGVVERDAGDPGHSSCAVRPGIGHWDCTGTLRLHALSDHTLLHLRYLHLIRGSRHRPMHPTSTQKAVGNAREVGDADGTRACDGIDVATEDGCPDIVLDRPAWKNVLDPAIAESSTHSNGRRPTRCAARRAHAATGDDFCAGADWVATNTDGCAAAARPGSIQRRTPLAGAPPDRAASSRCSCPVVCAVRGLGRRPRVPDRARRRLHRRRRDEPLLGAVPRARVHARQRRHVARAAPRRRGPGARSCCCSAARCPAREAADWGLIHRAVPDDELDAAVDDARRRAGRRADGRHRADEAVHPPRARRLARPRRWRPRRCALELSRAAADFKEGLAAFRETRPPGSRAGRGTTARWSSRRSCTRSRTASRRSRSTGPTSSTRSAREMVRELRAAPTPTAEADDDVWIDRRHRATGGRSAPAPTSTEIPDDGRVVYDEPYLSTYAQWEAPQEGTPPFRTMTKPILTAVNGLCCGAGLDCVTTGDIVDRVRPGRVLRSPRQHRPGVGPRDGAAGPGAADATSPCGSPSPAATSA